MDSGINLGQGRLALPDVIIYARRPWKYVSRAEIRGLYAEQCLSSCNLQGMELGLSQTAVGSKPVWQL